MTFNEAFQVSIAERNSKFIDNGLEIIIENIAKAHDDLDLSMRILDEVSSLEAYCCEHGLIESAGVGTAPPGDVPSATPPTDTPSAPPRDERSEKPKHTQEEKKRDNEIQERINKIMNMIASKADTDANARTSTAFGYQPAPGITTVETMSDMSFPKNIVFFIETLVKWLKNMIKYGFAAIKNLIVLLLTGGKNSDEYKKSIQDLKDNFKIDFKKTKVLQTIGLPVNFTGRSTLVDPVIAVRTTSSGDVERINQLGLFEDVQLSEADKRISTEPVIISVDLSKDIFALKEFVQHFFNLYDNAYGSNEEYLFGTDDVKILLSAFKVMDDNIRSGKTVQYSIGGRIAEADLIDADRMRDVAIKTKINTDALTQAYTQTYNKIKDILKVIQAKSMTSVIDNLSSFRLLSHATVGATLDLLDVIEPRIKEASKLEKDLEKINSLYSKLITGLQNTGSNIMGAYGKVNYMSAYSKQMSNLFNAARYTSQTISMRISALALYIKQLKDIKDVIVLLKKFKKKSFLGLTKAD